MRDEYDARNLDYDGDGDWFVKDKEKGDRGGNAERGYGYEQTSVSKKANEKNNGLNMGHRSGGKQAKGNKGR